MKILRILFGGFLGLLLATIVSWGSLYLFGVLVLDGKGSLFDTNPEAADTFFILWFAFTVSWRY